MEAIIHSKLPVTTYQTTQYHKCKTITQIFTAVKISNLIKSHDKL